MIEAATISLLRENAFLGNIVVSLNTVITDKVPTAGVSITNKVNLYINPGFWGKLERCEQVAVLKHECYHLLLQHITRGKNKMHSLFNMACDYAINEYIDNLPASPEFKPLLVEDLQKEFPNVERYKHAEYYYDLLKEANKDLIDKLNKMLDDHSTWKEGEGGAEVNPTVAEAILKDLVRRAAQGKNAGNLSQHDKRLVDDLLGSSKVNWKNTLNYFINRTIKDKKENTRKRLNRRLGILAQGRKKSDVLRLHVGIDTSGSIDKEAADLFFSEINKIYSITKEVTVMECDTHVHRTYPYTGKPPKDCTGGGGTNYQPMLEQAKKDGADALIIFGDMQHFDELVNLKIPVLFVNHTSYEFNPPFGKHIRM